MSDVLLLTSIAMLYSIGNFLLVFAALIIYNELKELK